MADLNAAGDQEVHFLELPTQDTKDGIGGNWHPNVKTHQILADFLAAQLIKDLGWTPPNGG